MFGKYISQETIDDFVIINDEMEGINSTRLCDYSLEQYGQKEVHTGWESQDYIPDICVEHETDVNCPTFPEYSMLMLMEMMKRQKKMELKIEKICETLELRDEELNTTTDFQIKTLSVSAKMDLTVFTKTKYCKRLAQAQISLFGTSCDLEKPYLKNDFLVSEEDYHNLQSLAVMYLDTKSKDDWNTFAELYNNL